MRFLIVANQTLTSTRMHNAVRNRVNEGAARFHVVVPATAAQDQAEPVDGDAVEVAEQRLQQALEAFREMGAQEVTGEVGTAEPMKAIEQAVTGEHYDAVILSTLPLGVSKWLKMDLPNRVRRKFPKLFVDHLEVETAGA